MKDWEHHSLRRRAWEYALDYVVAFCGITASLGYAFAPKPVPQLGAMQLAPCFRGTLLLQPADWVRPAISTAWNQRMTMQVYRRFWYFDRPQDSHLACMFPVWAS